MIPLNPFSLSLPLRLCECACVCARVCVRARAFFSHACAHSYVRTRPDKDREKLHSTSTLGARLQKSFLCSHLLSGRVGGKEKRASSSPLAHLGNFSPVKPPPPHLRLAFSLLKAQLLSLPNGPIDGQFHPAGINKPGQAFNSIVS